VSSRVISATLRLHLRGDRRLLRSGGHPLSWWDRGILLAIALVSVPAWLIITAASIFPVRLPPEAPELRQ
jgi:hypothetical protein